jgi:hypothetical protein
VLGSARASAAVEDLASALRAHDGWTAYDVALAADAGAPCCYAEYSGHHGVGQCDLDGRGWNIGRDDRDAPRLPADTLRVYVHVEHGAIDKLRGFVPDCPLRGTELVRRLEHVNADDSVALLQHMAQNATPHEREHTALALLAMHAAPSADAALIALAAPNQPRKQREQALFWMAQLRGVDGAQRVARVAHDDADAELRAEAVFDLSQAHGIDAYGTIHDIAQHDAATHVRSQALFWMAQMGDARARADITAAIGSDSSDEVREQAVFALSQLKGEQATAALIALVRGDYPRAVKKQALFWLSESGRDVALRFIDDVLARNTAR